MNSTDKPIRVIVAEDHALFRQGLRALFEDEPDIRIVAEVANASELRPTLEATPCDLLLLDLQMDRWLINDIEELSKLVPIVVLTASERPSDAVNAMHMGARAIVQKRFAVESLIEAIRTVAQGLVWMPPMVQSDMLAIQRGVSTIDRLTPREADIIRYVATGLRNREIAVRLSITESTVKTHLNHVFHKLGIRDRVELALYAIQTGITTVTTGQQQRT